MTPNRYKQIAAELLGLVAVIAGIYGCWLWMYDLSQDGETAAIVGFCVAYWLLVLAATLKLLGELLWVDLKRLNRDIGKRYNLAMNWTRALVWTGIIAFGIGGWILFYLAS